MGFYLTISSTSGFNFLTLTGTSDMELDTKVIFLDLPSLLKASSGAFLGRTLFSVLANGLKLVKVALGA